MYLQIKTIELNPDTYGNHIKITKVGSYDNNGKFIKWVKLDENVIMEIKEAKFFQKTAQVSLKDLLSGAAVKTPVLPNKEKEIILVFGNNELENDLMVKITIEAKKSFKNNPDIVDNKFVVFYPESDHGEIFNILDTEDLIILKHSSSF